MTDSCGLSLLEEVSVSHALQSLQDATNLLVSWTRHLTGQPRVTDSIYTVLSRLSIRKVRRRIGIERAASGPN